MIFVSFALPAFAWGNPIPNGNASEAGVYNLSPLYDVRYHRYSDSGYNIESTYSVNNYLSLNNRSNYTPTFPQVQSSGVYTTTVDLISDSVGEAYQMIYNVETEFDPSYYNHGTEGYLDLEVKQSFLFTDEKTMSMKDGLDSSVYKYLTYFYTYSAAHDPDFTVDPYIIYNCSYFYYDGNNLLVSENVYNNVKMNAHYDSYSSRYYYYLYEHILENAPVEDFSKLKYVYIDFMYAGTGRGSGLDHTYPVGYGGTYSNDASLIIDFNSLVSEMSNVDSLQSMIEHLKEENKSLQQEYENCSSENNLLRKENNTLSAEKENWKSKFYENASEMAGLREENQALEKKNFELRNTTGAIDEYFTGISSALWNGLNEISQIGYSYVDSNGVTQTITVGSLITISVIGVVAFFVIKLFRGG